VKTRAGSEDQTPSILPDDIWTSPEPPEPGEIHSKATERLGEVGSHEPGQIRPDSSSHHVFPLTEAIIELALERLGF
jgi:hypothetical protein